MRLRKLDLMADKVGFHELLGRLLTVEPHYLAVPAKACQQGLSGAQVALCLGKPALHEIPDNLLTTSHK